MALMVKMSYLGIAKEKVSEIEDIGIKTIQNKERKKLTERTEMICRYLHTEGSDKILKTCGFKLSKSDENCKFTGPKF